MSIPIAPRLLPPAAGTGSGWNIQAPLARAVVVGLVISTLITRVSIPVVYTLFQPNS